MEITMSLLGNSTYEELVTSIVEATRDAEVDADDADEFLSEEFQTLIDDVVEQL